MTLTRKLLAFLGGAGVATAGILTAVSGPAAATPPDPGVSSGVVWQKKFGESDLVMRRLRVPAGADTGWHYHSGPVVARVKKGVLSHFDASCASDGVYHAGAVVIERGGRDNVHIGRNLGRSELVLDVLYLLPAGGAPAIDAPNPGCPFE